MNINSYQPGAAISGSSEIHSSASGPMSPTQKMSNLFDQIDPTGTGQISQAQFMQAFQTMSPPASFQAAGAEKVWSQLDPNKTGSVSRQDFISSMTTMMKQLRGHHHHGGSQAGAGTANQGASLLEALGGTPGTTGGNSGPGTFINTQV